MAFTTEEMDQLTGVVQRELQREIVPLRNEMRSEFKSVRSDITDIRSDITEIRSDITDIRSDITEIRGDITDIRSDITDIRSDISGIHSDIVVMKEDISHLHGRVDQLFETESEDIQAAFHDIISLRRSARKMNKQIRGFLNDQAIPHPNGRVE